MSLDQKGGFQKFLKNWIPKNEFSWPKRYWKEGLLLGFCFWWALWVGLSPHFGMVSRVKCLPRTPICSMFILVHFMGESILLIRHCELSSSVSICYIKSTSCKHPRLHIYAIISFNVASVGEWPKISGQVGWPFDSLFSVKIFENFLIFKNGVNYPFGVICKYRKGYLKKISMIEFSIKLSSQINKFHSSRISIEVSHSWVLCAVAWYFKGFLGKNVEGNFVSKFIKKGNLPKSSRTTE